MYISSAVHPPCYFAADRCCREGQQRFLLGGRVHCRQLIGRICALLRTSLTIPRITVHIPIRALLIPSLTLLIPGMTLPIPRMTRAERRPLLTPPYMSWRQLICTCPKCLVRSVSMAGAMILTRTCGIGAMQQLHSCGSWLLKNSRDGFSCLGLVIGCLRLLRLLGRARRLWGTGLRPFGRINNQSLGQQCQRLWPLL